MAGERPGDRPVDIVLTGGPIQTMDAARSWARALAIRDGAIVAVGTERDVKPLIGPSTRVIDLHERLATPGFQDAHIHPVSSGIDRIRCDLTGSRGLDQYLELIGDYARANAKAEWILGAGWSMDDFPGGIPDKADLDRIVPDRPVFLPSRDGHSAWVNSRALEIAGIARDTPDPRDGRIERDSDGEPVGTLQEGAQNIVVKVIPADTAEDREDGLLVAQEYLHSLGLTAWQDAIVTPEIFDTYVSAAERDLLTARVVGALWWERGRGDDQIPELLDRRERGSVGRFRATTVKVMQDGVLENFTGAMIEPYLDGHGKVTDRRGISFIDPERLPGYVTRLDAEGFQVHFHAIGDRAVREALDAFAAARAANGWTDGRHHISHIQVIHPEDVPRFAQLGVAANAQPYWACLEGQMINLTIPFLGPERTTWQYPYRSLRRAGAVLAMGSDWAVSTANPLLEMEVAVNRVSDQDRDQDVFLPDERLDLIDAFAAFTVGSAYVNHLDEITGTLEVGKQADLIVLDRNVFAADAGPIGDARVVLTLVAGKAVFEDAAQVA
jgi:predicted amidohydrolase YtcJ